MARDGRLPVRKTYKLYIAGEFPRSESGRAYPVADPSGVVVARVARGSRKDLRDAVRAARGAQKGWAGRTAYGTLRIHNRSPIWNVRDVIVTSIANGPGALAPTLRLVSDASINVEYAYGAAAEGSPSATVVIGVDDAQRAAAAAGV